MNNINVKKSVLKNGLKVITMTRDSQVFSMEVGIKAGSLYEDKGKNGISHLVEHMIFKGTSKRTADELNEHIENLAGELDIYTTYHQTVMTVNVMKDRAKECMEIVSDLLMNAVFPEKELRLEKKVIIEEIKMSGDDAEDLCYLGLYKAAFPEEWYKYHIAGTITSVKGIKKDMLEEFYRSYYTPQNTYMCIVSPYAHEEIVALVEEHFNNWEGEGPMELSPRDAAINSRKVVGHKKGIGQTHVLYGFDIHGLTRKEDVALALLSKKMGSGPNSVLFRELRDKKGYAYTVYSDVDYAKSIRMFYIYTCISEENLKATLSIIDSVVDGFKTGEFVIDESTITLMKDVYATDIAIAMESSAHIADYLLDGELNHNNPLEYHNVLKMMDTITIEDIRAVIEKVLQHPVIHILSPTRE